MFLLNSLTDFITRSDKSQARERRGTFCLNNNSEGDVAQLKEGKHFNLQ